MYSPKAKKSLKMGQNVPTLLCLSLLVLQAWGGVLPSTKITRRSSMKSVVDTKGTDYLRDNFDERGWNFEGDILLSPSTFSGAANPKFRWPNATIPFVMDGNFTASEKSKIKSGMEDITSHTCIKFIERKNETDYVFIKKGGSGSGCNSHVGRQGNMQILTLQVPGCTTKGIAAHELIHAIGFRHEHSRMDRDDFITVNYENIEARFQYAFNKYGPSVVNPFGVPYDYGSIMHYSPYAFSINRSKPTITTKQKNVSIGQREKLSAKDIQKINNMYKCNLAK